MDMPIVLTFHIKPISDSIIIRSATLKEYFSNLTTNVEVLYPTQVHGGLLLCKSKRTEEKILNMSHVLSNGSTILLSPLTQPLFQQIKCIISGQVMQSSDIHSLFHQCLPFLHASDGKIQVNADKSVVLEGHIFVLNAIHSFLLNKASKSEQSTNKNSSESISLSCKNLTIQILSGKLVEQNVESILIPMNDKYKIHKTFYQQIEALGGTHFINYFKELKTKKNRAHEGDIILLTNQGLNIPAKLFIFFIVPRLLNKEAIQDKSSIDLFQTTYEQIILHALQNIEQHGIINIATPILEPNVQFAAERRYAKEMTARAMISAIRLYSQNPSSKLKRICIVENVVQVKRMIRRVKEYQNQAQKPSTLNNSTDVDLDDGQSFVYLFGVPKIAERTLNASETDEDIEPEDPQLPYEHKVKA